MSGGFQYKNSVLQFFPHAEGYVNVIDSHGENNYNYVFNYTDHLGNIRISYGVDPSTGILKIMEENHYYAFGLKHTNYNSDRLLFQKGSTGGVTLKKPTIPVEPSYKYKYQSQERQTELNLNWDSFKWRNYDYAIGRFMSIDPLTEDYPLWTPYAFSGNRVVDSRELEGLEPHTVHSSLQEASRNFSQQYNGYSIDQKREISTQFYKTADGNYSYATPKIFLEGLSEPKQSGDIPDDGIIVGEGHTHGNDNNFNYTSEKETNGRSINGRKDVTLKNIDNYIIDSHANSPSGTDQSATKENAEKNNNFEASYVYTPSGLVYSFKKDPKTGEYTFTINKNLSKTNPSDENSNMRINNVSPNNTPQVLPLEGTINFQD